MLAEAASRSVTRVGRLWVDDFRCLRGIDLELVKAGPAARCHYLDELLGVLAVRYDAARADLDRILRQRNALLRSGVRDAEATTTLEVLDEQLVTAAAELVRGRLQLVER